MKRPILVGAFLCVAFAASPYAHAVAGPKFLICEGKNAVYDGQGGEKQTIEGIDFWSNGDPPHRFRIIGSLTDRRHETGLIGMVRMSELNNDIAKAAKAAGGDAVILLSEHSDTVGSIGFADTNLSGYGGRGWFQASGSTIGLSRAIRKHAARYMVVQYIPDAGPILPPAAVGPLTAQDAHQSRQGGGARSEIEPDHGDRSRF